MDLTFSQRLRHAGLRQSDFGLLVGLTPNHVSRMARGVRDVPEWALAYLAAWRRLSPTVRSEMLGEARGHWSRVLRVRRTVDAEAIHAAYRRAAKGAHPDAGGSHGAFLKVRTAYEAALKERR